MFYVLLGDRKTRDDVMAHLKRNGISAVFHYIPLHSSTMGKKFGYAEGDLPITEDSSARLLRLPFFPDITEEEQLRVVSCLAEFFERASDNSAGVACL